MLEKELQAAFLHLQKKFNKPGITPVILQYFKEQDKIFNLSYDKDTLSKIALRMVDHTYKTELGLEKPLIRMMYGVSEYKKARDLLL